MPWKSISRSLSRVYIMSKQRIWSTGIIVAWTPAIYICPEWMRKASLMSKAPAPSHHPGNLCYHLLWWTIYWSHYRWWFRMCCLINKLHNQSCNPAWTWRTKSSTMGMVTYINYLHFYVKFIQCSPVYWIHQSIKVFRYIWQMPNHVSDKNLVGKILKQWLDVWNSFRHTLPFCRLYHDMGRVCCQHVTTRIPEIPAILKNNDNLILCDISILRWKYRISDQGHRCKESPLSYKWVTCHYLWRP